MEFKISYTDKEITPWGGMYLLKQMLKEIGFRNVMSNCPDLPRPGSNRGYSPIVILESFLVSIWSGANRFLHTEITRHDKVLSDIFDWKQAPVYEFIFEQKRTFAVTFHTKNDALLGPITIYVDEATKVVVGESLRD